MLDRVALSGFVAATKSLKILYVEDNEENRVHTLKILKDFFDYIDVAENGVNGMEMYDQYHYHTNRYYDLVISDMHMPKMDGLVLSQKIRKINKRQNIIIISAYSDKKHLIDFINLGVNGFLLKPVSLEKMIDAFSSFYETFRRDNYFSLSENCMYDNLHKKLIIDGNETVLSVNEGRFLEFFLGHERAGADTEDIFNYIYYDEPYKDFSSDAVKSLVKRLRKKLPPELITYERGIGYRLIYNTKEDITVMDK